MGGYVYGSMNGYGDGYGSRYGYDYNKYVYGNGYGFSNRNGKSRIRNFEYYDLYQVWGHYEWGYGYGNRNMFGKW
jgi:hypothetical protein